MYVTIINDICYVIVFSWDIREKRISSSWSFFSCSSASISISVLYSCVCVCVPQQMSVEEAGAKFLAENWMRQVNIITAKIKLCLLFRISRKIWNVTAECSLLWMRRDKEADEGVSREKGNYYSLGFFCTEPRKCKISYIIGCQFRCHFLLGKPHSIPYSILL